MGVDTIADGIGSTPKEKIVSMLDQLSQQIYGKSYPGILGDPQILTKKDRQIRFNDTKFREYLASIKTQNLYEKHKTSMITHGRKKNTINFY